MKNKVEVRNDLTDPTIVLATEIVKVSEAFHRLKESRITQRTLTVLLQDMIGANNITRAQIDRVLNAVPELLKFCMKPEKKQCV